MKKMTLHDAIILVLQENNNRWMDIAEIAAEINRRNLYQRKKDNEPLPGYQVHLRTMTAQYNHLFEKDGTLVRLKEE